MPPEQNQEELAAAKAAEEAEAQEKGKKAGDKQENDTVSRSEYAKAQAELNRLKAAAKEAAKKDSEAKTAALKQQEKYKELAEQKEKEAAEANERSDKIQSSYLSDKKFSALQLECQKLGIRPEAVSDLEGVDLGEIEVETTSTGKINVLGAQKFAARLKTTKPHWFLDAKTAKVNAGGGRVLESDGTVTADDVYKAEIESRKSGDKSKYYELHKKFQQQRVAARRH